MKKQVWVGHLVSNKFQLRLRVGSGAGPRKTLPDIKF